MFTLITVELFLAMYGFNGANEDYFSYYLSKHHLIELLSVILLSMSMFTYARYNNKQRNLNIKFDRTEHYSSQHEAFNVVFIGSFSPMNMSRVKSYITEFILLRLGSIYFDLQSGGVPGM